LTLFAHSHTVAHLLNKFWRDGGNWLTTMWWGLSTWSSVQSFLIKLSPQPCCICYTHSQIWVHS
jgi:hypothetical protein